MDRHGCYRIQPSGIRGRHSSGMRSIDVLPDGEHTQNHAVYSQASRDDAEPPQQQPDSCRYATFLLCTVVGLLHRVLTRRDQIDTGRGGAHTHWLHFLTCRFAGLSSSSGCLRCPSPFIGL
eukprot:1401315-Amphidinium_carterae.1